MNCCDEYCSAHGCNQGRNCPVRIERIRQVKVRLDRDARAPWLVYLRHLIKWLLIVIVMALLAGLAVSLLPSNPGTNCRALIAGWHPDVPAHIRIKCREAGHA